MKMTKEMITTLQNAKSAEDILQSAKANDIALTKEQAELLFHNYHGNSNLTEEELASVSGGCPVEYKRNEEDDYYHPVVVETTHFIPEE